MKKLKQMIYRYLVLTQNIIQPAGFNAVADNVCKIREFDRVLRIEDFS
jgi:hypothetical protein